jgi:hypothetical protein
MGRRRVVVVVVVEVGCLEVVVSGATVVEVEVEVVVVVVGSVWEDVEVGSVESEEQPATSEPNTTRRKQRRRMAATIPAHAGKVCGP